MREQWVDVEGFTNYAVSNYGEVLNKQTGRLVAQRPHTNGHMRVTLYEGGRVYDRYVSQLVAHAFYDVVGRPRVTQVNGDPRNNRIDNIRVGRGTAYPDLRVRRPGWGRRVRIRETGEVFRTVGDCARYLGGSSSKVYSVLRGERSSYLGRTYEWFDGGDQ